MASLSSFGSAVFIISIILAFSSSSMVAFASNFWQDFDLTWGGRRAQILNDGQLLTLSLDRVSGSALQSKNAYLFGKIDMQMKLVPGNSAGTVTAYYMRADTIWDEIDFEFLGNLSGDPYTLHTNIYTDGQGGREQQFRLWFDPSADFHTYSVFWSPECIIYYVDETPIRVFGNLESSGVPFPKKQAMKIYSSIWNGDQWATRGGAVKIDWSQAPFTSSYRDFSARSCMLSSMASSCAATSISQVLDPASQRMLRWVRNNHMIYDYCTDTKRFPQGLPPECTVTGL